MDNSQLLEKLSHILDDNCVTLVIGVNNKLPPDLLLGLDAYARWPENIIDISYRSGNRNLDNIIPTIAHELGHLIAFKEWNRTKKINFHKSNLEENPFPYEVEAWEIGKSILQGLGYEDWEHFERVREIGLSSYDQSNEPTVTAYPSVSTVDSLPPRPMATTTY